MLKSRYRTDNPDEATLFFVPYYAAIHAKKRERCVDPAGKVNSMLKKSPHYRKYGHLHMVVIASANGMNKLKGIARGCGIELHVDAAMRNGAVAIPYPMSFFDAGEPSASRSISVWFEGTKTRSARNPIRNDLVGNVFGGVNGSFINVLDQPPSNDVTEMSSQRIASSRFCLVPKGLTPASRRVFEAIAHDCVPVVISDKFQLPYADWLDYNEFAMKIPESCMSHAESAWLSITSHDAQWRQMQATAHSLRDIFMYGGPNSMAADAIMVSVLLKRERKSKSGKKPAVIDFDDADSTDADTDIPDVDEEDFAV